MEAKPTEPILRLSFVQHGGFVPRCRVCDVDTRTLPAEEAAVLQGLVAASGILGMVTRRMPGACDVITNVFDIETPDGRHRVVFDGPTVPESVRPLLEYLLARSHDALDEVGSS